ncbi:MAG: hypothetical protein A3G49_01515 [Candidatus Sungbacteria bacterium RIFCSPLOWO2_12_FULL_41_11]|uniref:Plasmid stabilization protein n=1 Tax=Candidatus Sungbacteria bacterium RIFCSPLOWO2_12_FULL_41_11 TaxID=1802286 RepID=A0A1G2LSY5_9BACT|nr:MAG: hypothetical protein UV01_C0011G0022 [Parcubacteria group bacterium GW2011_GWA2_42_14]OHA13901.1 MAG: hypothetical protein A3G49_01515 [Candidatus Sungbacteria bacterium RIFCSPLOWO2_12_FULL_41_11]
MTRIFFRPKALAGLGVAPRKYQLIINEAIRILEQGLFPPHTKKLEDSMDGYRTRVGRWRILFTLKSGEIEVVDIFLKKGKSDYKRRY